MLNALKKRGARRAVVERLWTAVSARAREEVFFRELQVADTFDGRFDVFHRPPERGIRRNVFDMFAVNPNVARPILQTINVLLTGTNGHELGCYHPENFRDRGGLNALDRSGPR